MEKVYAMTERREINGEKMIYRSWDSRWADLCEFFKGR
jgi:hypothetical protein